MTSDPQLPSPGTALAPNTATKENLKFGPPRNGKIAKLPKELRDLINRMLADHATGSDIITALAERDISLNHENISNWKHGGFEDWLIEQEWQAEVKLQREYAFDLLDTGDATRFQQAVIQLAVTQIFQALKRGNFNDDASNYTRLLNALSRLAREAFVMKKYGDLCAREQFQELDPKRKLTDKDRQLWYAKVEEMFRFKPGELWRTAMAQTNKSPPNEATGVPEETPPFSENNLAETQPAIHQSEHHSE